MIPETSAGKKKLEFCCPEYRLVPRLQKQKRKKKKTKKEDAKKEDIGSQLEVAEEHPLDKNVKLNLNDNNDEFSDDDDEDMEARMAELLRQERIRRKQQRMRREKERVKKMFRSTTDPFERPYEWWEATHVTYAFYHSPVSSRLEHLMGSNIVRLTDRKYMLKLMMRIREDYETRQENRIQNRKFRELMRTKRLILSRFIPMCEAPPEILEYHLFQLYSYCDKLIERRQKKRKPRKKVEISKSLYQLLYPESIEDDVEEEEDKEVPTKEIIIDGVITLIPLSPEELEEIEKDKVLQADIRKGYMHTKDEYENLHYEAEEVKQLKGIESVKEMYEMAHEIIGSLFSIHRQKRKRCLHDQEMLKKMDKEQGIEDDDEDEDEEGDNDEEEE